MLPVGVDPAAERVAALRGLAIPRRDPGPQAAVDAEGDDDRSGGTRHLGRRVGGAVVDHEHVHVGQRHRELGEHRGEVLLLVPGGDEDDGVGLGAHRGRVQRRIQPEAARVNAAVLASPRQPPSRKETARARNHREL